MEETSKNKLKRSHFFRAALVLSIVGLLLPFVATVVLGVAMGWYGVLPPCKSCDDPNIGGQGLVGLLIFTIFGSGALLLLLSEILSLIFVIVGFIKKEMKELAALPLIILVLNIFVFIISVIPGSPFFLFAEFITKIFWGCKCYGDYGG